MYCLHILLKKAASASMTAFTWPRKAPQVLATMALSMEAKFSLMEVIREALIVWARWLVCVSKQPHTKQYNRLQFFFKVKFIFTYSRSVANLSPINEPACPNSITYNWLFSFFISQNNQSRLFTNNFFFMGKR